MIDERGDALVVEDDPASRMLMTRMLAHLGFRASTAANAKEALEQADICAPDVVLLDIHFPGMSFEELVAALRVKVPDVGIVACTATDIEGTRELCQRADVTSFITKPIMMDALASTLAEVMPPAARPPTSYLAELGDPALSVRIATLYLEALPGRLATIREAAASGALTELHRAAHALRSGTSIFGDTETGQIAADLERSTTMPSDEVLRRLDEVARRQADELSRQRAAMQAEL